MRTFKGFAIAFIVMGAVACSDPMSPSAEDVYTSVSMAPKGSSSAGGNGNVNFASTVCRLDSTAGRLECDYKLAGLGKKGSALLVLTGVASVDYVCKNSSGGDPRPERTTVRIAVDVDVFADQSGNAVGTVTADFLPVTRLECLVGFFTLYYPNDVVFNLDPNSILGLPTSVGEWALYAAATTANKTGQNIFFPGMLEAPVVEPVTVH
jgi:hypothetical protein